ncbi:hypothetical protein HUS73_05935 [Pandoraea nosoerga]|uniref:phage tail assembly chaperone n=1 Tax=Pandoraea nosoerga TaxID=2508296 RepID=UPI00197D7756|nr:hypothetical protein [Pandoraea nosoerga]MBN4665437.1 hypothetical protein [Pandoraea nosoerga]MBN4674962.1 hypothetical protein [Pandoraea nosoerga]MBN4680278.1 hypothetical protein [Pandoraea nosoerga]
MATEIEIRGVKYRIGKLSAMKQFHVSRKIAPLVPTLLPIMLELASSKGGAVQSTVAAAPDGGGVDGDSAGILSRPQLLQPFADGLASLPDDQAEYVIGECLAVVQRFQGNAWFSIWAAAAKQPTYDDIDLAAMIELSVKVIADSLGPFIAGWLTSPASHPPTTA